MLINKQHWLAGVVSVFISLLFLSCTSYEDKDKTADQLAFDVVDSLLGPVYDIPSAKISFRPPIGFEPAPDSIFSVLQATLANQIGSASGMKLQLAFLDMKYAAGVLAAEIEGLTLKSDTAAFLDNYRRSILDLNGREGVREGEYWVDRVFVKNFLITDSLNVHFQLICLTGEAGAVELNYFCPRQFYPELIKLFESSIGSLKLISEGGGS